MSMDFSDAFQSLHAGLNITNNKSLIYLRGKVPSEVQFVCFSVSNYAEINGPKLSIIRISFFFNRKFGLSSDYISRDAV